MAEASPSAGASVIPGLSEALTLEANKIPHVDAVRCRIAVGARHLFRLNQSTRFVGNPPQGAAEVSGATAWWAATA